MTKGSRGHHLAALGRFDVRYRWWIVLGWVVLTVVCTLTLPSLGSVTRNDSSAFLPRDAPSVKALDLAAPFQSRNQGTAVLVASRSGGPLNPVDQATFARVEALAKSVPEVASVTDEAISGDDRARTALVRFDLPAFNGGPKAAAAVDHLRLLAARSGDEGLAFHLTGTLPVVVDQQRAANSTQKETQVLSILLILVLLAIAFRAVLAPIVVLLPAGLALALAEPLIAASTHIGVQISSLLQIILVVLVLGAGTDYGLFLIFRYREGLRSGTEPAAALVTAIDKVGETVTFSAATVAAALLSLVLASFGLYRGVGPGLAIGIVVVLAVELTLLPALLAILGRAAFWPRLPAAGPPSVGVWGRVAARVCMHPYLTLVAGVALLGALSMALLGYAPSGFNSGGAIPRSDSSLGEAVLSAHFPATSVNPTNVVFRLRHPAWQDPGAIDAAEDGLDASNALRGVSGPLDATGRYLPPRALSAAYRRLGPPSLLPVVRSPGSTVPGPFYDAYRATAQFISVDGRTIEFDVALRAGSPGSTEALQAIPRVRASVAGVARAIGATDSGVAGQAPAAADVAAVSGTDVVRVIPVVLVVLALLLGSVLRSVVAPTYLVASVALSYSASLGLAVLIFVAGAGQLGINFTLPFFLFIFVMALGEDYNILVMTRIREEAARLPLTAAVPEALGSTGTTVTSAGLILAGTFGVLALTANGQVRQIGTGLALGILLDTFVVRTLLVPSAVMSLGRWNWWPSSLGRRREGLADDSFAVVKRVSAPGGR